jgi:hypothetical protein
LWSLGKIVPRVFTIFRLGRIASGYVDNLEKHIYHVSILANKAVGERKYSAKMKSVPRCGERSC